MWVHYEETLINLDLVACINLDADGKAPNIVFYGPQLEPETDLLPPVIERLTFTSLDKCQALYSRIVEMVTNNNR